MLNPCVRTSLKICFVTPDVFTGQELLAEQTTLFLLHVKILRHQLECGGGILWLMLCCGHVWLPYIG